MFHNASLWKVPNTHLTLSYKHSFSNMAWKNLLQLQHTRSADVNTARPEPLQKTHTQSYRPTRPQDEVCIIKGMLFIPDCSLLSVPISNALHHTLLCQSELRPHTSLYSKHTSPAVQHVWRRGAYLLHWC